MGQMLLVCGEAMDGIEIVGVAVHIGSQITDLEPFRDAYARVREAFGKPIIRFQPVHFKIADMKIEVDGARLLTLRAAWLHERGEATPALLSAAKLYATETANRACYTALQLMGGVGYTLEYPLERYARDARVTSIYEGTSEIQRVIIARELLKEVS